MRCRAACWLAFAYSGALWAGADWMCGPEGEVGERSMEIFGQTVGGGVAGPAGTTLDEPRAKDLARGVRWACVTAPHLASVLGAFVDFVVGLSLSAFIFFVFMLLRSFPFAHITHY